jgi:sortase A
MSRWARPAAVLFAAAGTALLGWIALTLVWGEPVTAVQAARAQRTLRHELAAAPKATPAQFRANLREGDALGRITIPRIDLRTVVVEGTSSAVLERGPGHYPRTPLPGSGGTVAVAGHRTTYLQPFRHIDELRAGDRIELDVPYGRFRYAVTGQKIVGASDWSILRRRPYEQLVLSACHPLYSASHRIVVFARRV